MGLRNHIHTWMLARRHMTIELWPQIFQEPVRKLNLRFFSYQSKSWVDQIVSSNWWKPSCFSKPGPSSVSSSPASPVSNPHETASETSSLFHSEVALLACLPLSFLPLPSPPANSKLGASASCRQYGVHLLSHVHMKPKLQGWSSGANRQIFLCGTTPHMSISTHSGCSTFNPQWPSS